MVNRRKFMLVSILSATAFYCISSFVMLDPMWFIQQIIDLLKGTPTDRFVFLCMIPMKLFIDLCIYLPIFEKVKD